MTRTRSQSGRLARRKGQVFERLVAALLRPHWPDARRTVDQVRTAKVAGPDVAGCPYWLELAHGVAPDVAAKLAQGEADTDGRPVVVIARRNRRAIEAHCRLAVLTGDASHVVLVTLSLPNFLAHVAPITTTENEPCLPSKQHPCDTTTTATSSPDSDAD